MRGAPTADDVAGDEVVLAYHTVGAAIKARVDHPVPIRALRAFEVGLRLWCSWQWPHA